MLKALQIKCRNFLFKSYIYIYIYYIYYIYIVYLYSISYSVPEPPFNHSSPPPAPHCIPSGLLTGFSPGPPTSLSCVPRNQAVVIPEPTPFPRRRTAHAPRSPAPPFRCRRSLPVPLRPRLVAAVPGDSVPHHRRPRPPSCDPIPSPAATFLR
jgi:hypothetical protein